MVCTLYIKIFCQWGYIYFVTTCSLFLLFARPNCFQVVVRAFNESRMFYLCADTQDLANVRSLLSLRWNLGRASVTSRLLRGSLLETSWLVIFCFVPSIRELNAQSTPRRRNLKTKQLSAILDLWLRKPRAEESSVFKVFSVHTQM